MADVSLKILDPDTGQVLPCWIQVTGPGGNSIAPLGWRSAFPTAPGVDVGGRVLVGGKCWFAISGDCELPADQGECVLAVSRTPGYDSLLFPVDLFRGRLSVRLPVSFPKSSMETDFIAADLRTHCISNGTALLEGKSSGLGVVQTLASDLVPSVPSCSNLAILSESLGIGGPLLKGGCLVSSGTLNYQKGAGTLSLLDCHRPVFPLCIDQSNANQWSLMDWTAQCHRIRGLTVWADIERDDWPQAEGICASLENEIDCFELIDFRENRPGGLRLWYDLAGSGCFLPLVGSSGKESNAVPTGFLRTWILGKFGSPVFGEEAKSIQNRWVAGIKTGQTIATRYPLLFTKSVQINNGSCLIETHVGPVPERMEVEWVVPGGQVKAVKPVEPAGREREIVCSVQGLAPTHLAARLRASSGELIAHESFRPVLAKNDNFSFVTHSVQRLAKRLEEGLDRIQNSSGPNPTGEILYRLELFRKWLGFLDRK